MPHNGENYSIPLLYSHDFATMLTRRGAPLLRRRSSVTEKRCFCLKPEQLGNEEMPPHANRNQQPVNMLEKTSGWAGQCVGVGALAAAHRLTQWLSGLLGKPAASGNKARHLLASHASKVRRAHLGR